MPLWIFTVGQTFYSAEGQPTLPWKNIVISLVAFLVPIGLGMLFGTVTGN